MHHNTINTSSASIARALSSLLSNVSALTSRTEGLVHTKRSSQASQPAAPRRLSDAERARIVKLANDGISVAKIAQIIKTTRMTVYTVLHEALPGFRQRVFHDDRSAA